MKKFILALLLVPILAQAESMDRRSATGACMLFIKKVLHDPGSAEFSHGNEAYVLLLDNRAFVIRSVRSKNAFGAMRLNDFSCFLELRNGSIYPVLVKEKGTDTKLVEKMMKKWGIL